MRSTADKWEKRETVRKCGVPLLSHSAPNRAPDVWPQLCDPPTHFSSSSSTTDLSDKLTPVHWPSENLASLPCYRLCCHQRTWLSLSAEMAAWFGDSGDQMSGRDLMERDREEEEEGKRGTERVLKEKETTNMDL
ncbi:hypothetical protein ACOMHN_037875 [Nucella lapillus]